MANDILVIAETSGATIKNYSLELTGVAKTLAGSTGGKVHVAVIGKGVSAAAATLAQYGANVVHVLDGDAGESFNPHVWLAATAGVAKAISPSVVLATASPIGKDVLPRVAARLGVDVAADCTAIEIKGGKLWARRPFYAGKCFANVEWKGTGAQVASLRPNSYPTPAATPGATAEMKSITVDANAANGYQTKEVVKGETNRPDLTEAEIIVSGGRAMKDGENYKILWSLADSLGSHSTVGASRAAVDSGFVPHSMQVGQTGKTVSPKLYIACGISGAIQHLAGMRTSKVIVAINKDAEAPIFSKADYGIVGDLFDIVPKMTEAIKKLS